MLSLICRSFSNATLTHSIYTWQFISIYIMTDYVSKTKKQRTAHYLQPGFPLSWLQKFPGLSRTPEAFFQDRVVCQQCINIKTNISYYGVQSRAPTDSDFFVHTDKIRANFRKFWHLHMHHCVRLPHHRLENSRTFQDLSPKFQGLSRTKPIFRDFLGPGNFTKRYPGIFQEALEPCTTKT